MTNDYIGVEKVTAWPQDGKDGQPGYGVRYEDGYTSWSPKDVFEAAYKPVNVMKHTPVVWRFDGVTVRAEGTDNVCCAPQREACDCAEPSA